VLCLRSAQAAHSVQLDDQQGDTYAQDHQPESGKVASLARRFSVPE